MQINERVKEAIEDQLNEILYVNKLTNKNVKAEVDIIPVGDLGVLYLATIKKEKCFSIFDTGETIIITTYDSRYSVNAQNTSNAKH